MTKSRKFRTLAEAIASHETKLSILNTEVGWATGGKQLLDLEAKDVLILTDLCAVPVSEEDEAEDLYAIDQTPTEEAEAEEEEKSNAKDLYEITQTPTDDVLDLQYFFPYCDQFLRRGDGRRITWVIAGEAQDLKRVHCYLLAQATVHPLLTIYTMEPLNTAPDGLLTLLNHSSYSADNIGALFPLLRVGRKAVTDAERMIADAIPTCNLQETASYFASYSATNEKTYSGDRQLDLLLTAGYNQIDRLPDRLSGTSESSLKEPEKAALLDQFWPYVQKNLNRLPLLTQLIWLYLLYYLSLQKELMTGERNSPHWERLDRSLWDAIAYGEGILQLLENCELHSCHGAGYFTMVFQDIRLRQTGRIERAAAKRARLFRRYRSYTGEPAFLPLDSQCFLEFNIMDMAYTEDWTPRGISLQAGLPLERLFAGEFDYASSEDTEKIIHHFGMPLFHKMVRLNGGRFLCATPTEAAEGKAQITYYNMRATKKAASFAKTIEHAQAWSAYRILLPVTQRAEPHQEQYNTGVPTPLFEPRFLPNQPSHYEETVLPYLSSRLHDAKALYMSAEGRQEGSQRVREWLAANTGADRTVYLLDLPDMRMEEFDLYARGIFYFLATREQQESDFLLRLLFWDSFALCEFLRRAAIFYGKLGENPWLERVQIALSAPSKDGAAAANGGAERSDIFLVLAGKNLSTAYATAKLFAHYSLKNSNILLDQIRYLTRVDGKNSSKIKAQPQFPFDLVQASDGRSPFLKQVDHQLNQDLQTTELGCKLQNAHVRLGSKVHIADFYEAELLFHSVGYTYRFAYLIAEDLLHQLRRPAKTRKSPAHLLLVGYEGYSSILVEQVKELIELAPDKAKPKITHLQYLCDDEGQERIALVNGEWPSKKDVCACAFILPVATTLSTIYKIQNVLRRQYRETLPPSGSHNLCHYAIVVVGDASGNHLTSLYWREEANDQMIVLQPERRDGQPLMVRHYLMPKTNWFLPTECPHCGSGADDDDTYARIPLTQVDKTSTLPSLIFPLRRKGIRGVSFPLLSENTHAISLELREENEERLKSLKGNIRYGHIRIGSNHFQFSIDFAAYYRAEQRGCKNWLRSLRKEVDINAFNIIVSPRSLEDCLFLKHVVDNVFQHSLRLLFLPLESVFREDIRAKFSYITEEYRTACAGDYPPRINVYYVDHTLVSGALLQRGKSLVNMLLQDAKIEDRSNVSLFHKVILLLNRSTFDTVRALVPDPEKQFCAYAMLAVPTFNTHKDRCPTCDLTDLYTEISKCCATNELYWHFHHLAEKHALRSVEEHQQWRKEAMDRHAHYLQALAQHLSDASSTPASKDDIHTRRLLMQAFSDWRAQFPTEDFCTEKGQEQLLRLSFGDLLQKVPEKDRECCQTFLQKQIAAEREQRRLLATHRSMLFQEERAYAGWPEDPPLNQALLDFIWEQVQEPIEEPEKQKSTKKSKKSTTKAPTTFQRRERLISYLKVLSRGYLARLAPIRRSIFALLELALLELTRESAEKTDDPLLRRWMEYYAGQAVESSAECPAAITGLRTLLYGQGEVPPHELLQLYQLYLIIGKRLCDLQSNLLLKHEMLLRIQAFLKTLRARRQAILDALKASSPSDLDEAAALALLMPLPTREQMRIHYVRLVKWAAMSSAEESKAFPLQTLTAKLMEAPSDQSGTSDTLDPSTLLNCREMGQILRLENTRLLYTGIKRLHETCSTDTNWKGLQAHVRCERDACVPTGATMPDLHQNPLFDLFHFLGDDGPISDRELAGMLGLYQLIHELGDDHALKEHKNYIEKYNLLCFYMKQIAGFQNGCLVHRRSGENRVIAQSWAANSDEANHLLRTILRDCEPALQKSRLQNTEAAWPACISRDGKDKGSSGKDGSGRDGESKEGAGLVLALQLQRRSDSEQPQTVYLVFFDLEAPAPKTAPKTVSKSHRILFMRQHIQQLLERDLYVLHHFQSSYEDIRPCKEPNAHNNKSAVGRTFLHLSDLHITTQNESAIAEQIKGHETALREGDPELLLITGDIVRGDNTAIDLEKNYRAAGRIIRQIAAILWPEEIPDTSVPAPRPDWYRRVVIIPGNHDYASMNELAATHILRTTSGGVPVLKDGSPMSKFAYYIQFMHEWMGVDMSQSIQNNLNQIREYPELGVRIIALNTVSSAGPLRNNKVRLDGTFIHNVPAPHDADGPYCNIYLVHHTACYKPDYVEDQYFHKKLPAGSNYLEIGKQIFKACMEGQRDLVEKPTVTPAAKQRLKDICAKDTCAELEKEYPDLPLTLDLSYLLEHWRDLSNERCGKILSDYKLHIEMAERDTKAYLNGLQELIERFPPSVTLGGHTHHAAASADARFFHAACFYDKDDPTSLRFGRFTFCLDSRNKICVKYTFFPADPTAEVLEVPAELKTPAAPKAPDPS